MIRNDTGFPLDFSHHCFGGQKGEFKDRSKDLRKTRFQRARVGRDLTIRLETIPRRSTASVAAHDVEVVIDHLSCPRNIEAGAIDFAPPKPSNSRLKLGGLPTIKRSRRSPAADVDEIAPPETRSPVFLAVILARNAGTEFPTPTPADKDSVNIHNPQGMLTFLRRNRGMYTVRPRAV